MNSSYELDYFKNMKIRDKRNKNFYLKRIVSLFFGLLVAFRNFL